MGVPAVVASANGATSLQTDAVLLLSSEMMGVRAVVALADGATSLLTDVVLLLLLETMGVRAVEASADGCGVVAVIGDGKSSYSIITAD